MVCAGRLSAIGGNQFEIESGSGRPVDHLDQIHWPNQLAAERRRLEQWPKVIVIVPDGRLMSAD